MSNEPMEMIMSMTSSIAERSSHAVSREPGTVAAALKRLCAAYVIWRMERSALAVLSTMSDRELRDLGLARTDIANAVRNGDRALACE